MNKGTINNPLLSNAEIRIAIIGIRNASVIIHDNVIVTDKTLSECKLTDVTLIKVGEING
jgi:hypothetical protein